MDSQSSIFYDKSSNNGPKVVSSCTSGVYDLATLLNGKIKCNGRIEFKGCRTAAEDDNIAKQLSKFLPNVNVKGNATFAVDFGVYFVWVGAIINPVSIIERTYCNGELK